MSAIVLISSTTGVCGVAGVHRIAGVCEVDGVCGVDVNPGSTLTLVLSGMGVKR